MVLVTRLNCVDRLDSQDVVLPLFYVVVFFRSALTPHLLLTKLRRSIGFVRAVVRQGGGYIFHSDHSVPDNVSFNRHSRVLELVTEYGRF